MSETDPTFHHSTVAQASWGGWSIALQTIKWDGGSVRISPHTARFFQFLLELQGDHCEMHQLASLVRGRVITEIDESDRILVAQYISRIRRAIGAKYIQNFYRGRYALASRDGNVVIPATFKVFPRASIINLLQEELEATLPHARVVTAKIQQLIEGVLKP